jgi:hypothetical protein
MRHYVDPHKQEPFPIVPNISCHLMYVTFFPLYKKCSVSPKLIVPGADSLSFYFDSCLVPNFVLQQERVKYQRWTIYGRPHEQESYQFGLMRLHHYHFSLQSH